MAKKKTDEIAVVETKVETVTNPSALLELAVAKNLDVDKLEKLMLMQERWGANQAKKIFFESLTNFQSECPVLKKEKKVSYQNSTGRKTEYNYASLGGIVNQIKQQLKKYGMSYRWEMKDDGDKLVCCCIVSQINGHSEKTVMSAAKDASGNKNEIQSRGSSITYLQRYTLIAALGITTADGDDDGQAQAQTIKTEDPLKEYAEQITLITDLKGLQQYWEQNKDLHLNKRFQDLVNKRKVKLQK